MGVLYQQVTLIGLGLIGSSLGHAMRQHGLAETIVGYDCESNSRDTAVDIGVCDCVFDTPEQSVKGADLVFLCTPVSTMDTLAATIVPHMRTSATLSDVGSVKQHVINSMTPHLRPDIHFIPCHPIAGTERSGVRAGFADLFTGRWCIITPVHNQTPPPHTYTAAQERLASFWQGMGSKVVSMSAQHHDMVLAITSHVPHLIAYSVVGATDRMHQDSKSEIIQYSAGGFRDFTRIAASDPVMWRDVFLTNTQQILSVLDNVSTEIATLRQAIENNQSDFIVDYLSHTRNVRRSIIEAGQDVATPNFGRHQS